VVESAPTKGNKGPSSAATADDASVPEGSRAAASSPKTSRPDTTWKREAWERELLLVDKMLSVDPRNCASRDRAPVPTARNLTRSCTDDAQAAPGRPAVHAWDYRRHVLSSILALSDDAPEAARAKERRQELAFTRKKIESNFSNFSAWHQRMRVLGQGAFTSTEDMEAGTCLGTARRSMLA
jgi:hypothetical protein